MLQNILLLRHQTRIAVSKVNNTLSPKSVTQGFNRLSHYCGMTYCSSCPDLTSKRLTLPHLIPRHFKSSHFTSGYFPSSCDLTRVSLDPISRNRCNTKSGIRHVTQPRANQRGPFPLLQPIRCHLERGHRLDPIRAASDTLIYRAYN